MYRFVLKEREIDAMPQHGPYEMKTQLLMMEDNVSMHWLTFINPRRACALRSEVRLSVRLSVRLHLSNDVSKSSE